MGDVAEKRVICQKSSFPFTWVQTIFWRRMPRKGPHFPDSIAVRCSHVTEPGVMECEQNFCAPLLGLTHKNLQVLFFHSRSSSTSTSQFPNSVLKMAIAITLGHQRTAWSKALLHSRSTPRLWITLHWKVIQARNKIVLR